MKLLAVILADLALFGFALSQVLAMRRLRAQRAASRPEAEKTRAEMIAGDDPRNGS